jgi:hypothetical protein
VNGYDALFRTGVLRPRDHTEDNRGDSTADDANDERSDEDGCEVDDTSFGAQKIT